MAENKLPPHDIDAEEAVLGSILIDNTAIYKTASFLQQPDFYSEQGQLIYGACLALYQRNQAINQITVAQELARQQQLETCGGAAYLSHLISVCPTSLDVEDFGKIVFRLSVMRRLIKAAGQIEAIGYKADPDVESSLGQAEDILFHIHQRGSSQDFTHIRQVLDKYFETTAPKAEDKSHLGLGEGVISGFTGMDDLLGGFQPSDLIIIAGRPSMGKTSLAMNVARYAAVEQGGCVAVYSLEMSRESLVFRLLSSESRVDLQHIRFGHQHQTVDEEGKIQEAIGRLSEASLYIDDSPQLSITEMRSKARRLHLERKVDLVVVDYLQLMQGDGKRENRVQEISYISRSLKAIARELNIPVIAVSQLSRAVEWRASHIPQLSDLRESGSIEQDADVVIFVNREEYYYPTKEAWEKDHQGENYPPQTDIFVAKHRNGPTGQFNLRFIPTIIKFENIATTIANEEPSLL